MSDCILRFEQVSKVYPNGIRALSDINVEIYRKEFVFLVGETGTGKTTFLKLITCEEKPTSGRVFVDNQEVTKLQKSKVPFLRRRIGVVFQDFKLLPNKTCFENIEYALQVIGTKPSEIKPKVERALNLVGLGDKWKSYPAELSGGEKQRLSIARAIVNQPVIILADEPTGNLDPETSLDITQLLLRINKLDTTVIMATHEKGIVDRFRKRVIVIGKNGQLFADVEKGGYLYAI